MRMHVIYYACAYVRIYNTAQRTRNEYTRAVLYFHAESFRVINCMHTFAKYYKFKNNMHSDAPISIILCFVFDNYGAGSNFR